MYVYACDRCFHPLTLNVSLHSGCAFDHFMHFLEILLMISPLLAQCSIVWALVVFSSLSCIYHYFSCKKDSRQKLRQSAKQFKVWADFDSTLSFEHTVIMRYKLDFKTWSVIFAVFLRLFQRSAKASLIQQKVGLGPKSLRKTSLEYSDLQKMMDGKKIQKNRGKGYMNQHWKAWWEKCKCVCLVCGGTSGLGWLIQMTCWKIGQLVQSVSEHCFSTGVASGPRFYSQHQVNVHKMYLKKTLQFIKESYHEESHFP